MARYYYTTIPGTVSHIDLRYSYRCPHCDKDVYVSHNLFEIAYNVDRFSECDKKDSGSDTRAAYLSEMGRFSKKALEETILRCRKNVEKGDYSDIVKVQVLDNNKNKNYSPHTLKSHKRSLFDEKCPLCGKDSTLKSMVTWLSLILYPIYLGALGWVMTLIVAFLFLLFNINLFEAAKEYGFGLLASSAIVFSALGFLLAVVLFIREKLGLRKNNPENLPVITWPDINFATTEPISVGL